MKKKSFLDIEMIRNINGTLTIKCLKHTVDEYHVENQKYKKIKINVPKIKNNF